MKNSMRVNAFYIRNRIEINLSVKDLDVDPKDLIFSDDWSGKEFVGLEKLKKALESGSVSKVIVRNIEDLDTEFGSLEELFLFVGQLAQQNVTLVSISDRLDSSQAAARFISNAIDVWNSKADRIRTDRIKLGMIESQKRGTKLGRRESYNKEDIYDLRDQGLSLGKIADMLGTSKRTILNYLKRREGVSRP